MEELDRTSVNRMLPYSILDVERNYANTSDWLDNCEDPSENSTPVNPLNQHQPLTTPNGSVVGSEKKSHSHKMDSQSGDDSKSQKSFRYFFYNTFQIFQQTGVNTRNILNSLPILWNVV